MEDRHREEAAALVRDWSRMFPKSTSLPDRIAAALAEHEERGRREGAERMREAAVLECTTRARGTIEPAPSSEVAARIAADGLARRIRTIDLDAEPWDGLCPVPGCAVHHEDGPRACVSLDPLVAARAMAERETRGETT